MSGTTGDQQVGSYRILQPLGTGGMSSVYRAVHVETGHEVAIKILTRTLARNSTLLQRFLREAKSAEALVHPNIVTIYDRGIDLGRHYIVLEYVAGGDFHEYVRGRGPLDLAEASSVIRDVAIGLKYAASQGLIHRDVKPSNILRRPDGQIKIIDLGLALKADFEDERVMREGTTVGTVDYMAPEQARDSRAASIQSDIYSLGCTFYYLLTGIPPYPGGDITDKLTRHARSAVPNVADLRADVPERIATLIQRMMAKQPEDRLASYDELIAALDESQVDAKDRSLGYALVSVVEPKSNDLPDLPLLDGEDAGAEALGIDSSFGSIPVFPVESEAAELSLDVERSAAVSRASSQPAQPIPRLTRIATTELATGSDDLEEPLPTPKPAASVSAAVWIIGCLSLGIAGILLFLGWIEYMDSSRGLGGEGASASAPGADAEVGDGVEPAVRRVQSAARRSSGRHLFSRRVEPALGRSLQTPGKSRWTAKGTQTGTLGFSPIWTGDLIVYQNGHGRPFPIASTGPLSWCDGSSSRVMPRPSPSFTWLSIVTSGGRSSWPTKGRSTRMIFASPERRVSSGRDAIAARSFGFKVDISRPCANNPQSSFSIART